MFPNKIVFLILFFYSFPLFSQQPYYRQYTVNDGLASSTVYKIIQDKKGFIWIATENGAQRFDGKTFKTFSKENGLLDNSILDLFEDSRGRIWFLSLSGQVAYWDNGIIHNTLNDSILKKVDAKSNLTYFAEDKKGVVYISSFKDGIYEININTVKNYKYQDYFSKNTGSINKIWFSSDSVLWFSGNLGIYQKRNDNRFKEIFGFDEKKGRIFTPDRLLSISDSSFFIVARNEPYIIKLKNVGLEFEKINLGHIASLYNLIASKSGKNIWITTSKGVLLFDPRKEKVLSNYLEDQVINAVLEDKENNLWLGSVGGGVYYLNRNNFFSFSKNDGLADNTINDIILDKKNRLWVGYNNGKIGFIRNRIINYYPLPDISNQWSRINHFCLNWNDELLVSSERGSFTIKNQLKFSFILSKYSKYSVSKTVSNSSFGYTWLGTFDKIYTNYKNISIIFLSDRITSLLEGNDKNLWVGTSSGLKKSDSNVLDSKIRYVVSNFSKYPDNRIVFDSTLSSLVNLKKSLSAISIKNTSDLYKDYSIYNPELKTRINDIEESPNKTIWVATHGSGIFSIKNDTIIQQFKTDDGLSGNLCKVIKIENDSLIWVGTNKGLNKLTFSNNKLNVDIFNSANGLISDDVNAIELQNDTVWVATSGGLSFFNKNQITKNLIPPPVYISQVSLNNSDTTFLPHYDLTFSQNSISINFIGLSYQLPEKVSYKYQMQGLSDEWFLTSLNIVKYDYLPAGDYKFSVYAKSPDGVWSLNSAEVSFHISPPFYQTWWFYTLSFLFISGLISFLFFLRGRKIKKEERLKAETELRLLEGELKALRAQMNPHFLFNSLNSIQFLITKSSPDDAVKYLIKFSKLMRKILDNSRHSTILLNDELDTLKLYLEIESLRFNNGFNYSISVADDVDPSYIEIPPMLLQPFVENSIIHGISPKNSQGTINISVKWSQNYLLLSVDDNGIGRGQINKNESVNHKSVGISVTQQRLEGMTEFLQKKAKIEIIDKMDNLGNSIGTTVNIFIPEEKVN